MEALQRKLEAVLAAQNCRYSVVISNHTTGASLAINPEMSFPAASMIKVPIMYEVMRQAAAGSLSLDDCLTVTDDVKVDGAGILKELHAGLQLTIKELVTLMIVLSDNTATNLLIDRIGMAAINCAATDLGLKKTVLRRRMMDFTAAAAGHENHTCALDLARMFAAILDCALPQPYGKLMLNILRGQQVQDKLPFYLPETAVLAHKTGTLPGAEHDGGILFLSDSAYIICILTADLSANYQGLQLVATLGKVIYEHFTKEEL